MLDSFDAERAQRSFRDFADAGNLSNRKRREEARLAARRNPHEPSRLRLIRSHFGREPRRGQTAGAGKRCFVGDLAKELVCGSQGRPVQSLRAREIEIRFVNRNHFDDWREFHQDGGDPVAPFAVFFVMAVEKNRVWAESPCGSQRHCRMNAVFSCFVARGGNHATLIFLSANNYGFAAQFRPLQQLHGNKKRVHVHVQNGRLREGGLLLKGSVLRSKSRQLRHASSLRPTFVGLNLSPWALGYKRSVANTRGISARSLVTLTLVQVDASSRGWTAGKLLWPSSSTSMPPGFFAAVQRDFGFMLANFTH